jgi:Nitrous oxidase accessory protein
MIKILPLLCISLLFLNANVLQEAIDNAPRGATLTLPKGIYKGNIVINKPLTIQDKNENVTIQGEHNGSVITINSDDVTLKNLHITASGTRMDHLDSGITLHHVKHIQITECNITDSLYGIDMNMVKDSLISNNYITSKNMIHPFVEMH